MKKFLSPLIKKIRVANAFAAAQPLVQLTENIRVFFGKYGGVRATWKE